LPPALLADRSYTGGEAIVARPVSPQIGSTELLPTLACEDPKGGADAAFSPQKAPLTPPFRPLAR